MNRSGYTDDEGDGWQFNLWRGTVENAIHGKRGQKLLRDLAAALDAMPEKRLIHGVLEDESGVCALGCLGKARCMDLSAIDYYEPADVGRAFGIATALAAEIEWINDEEYDDATPEDRWTRVRAWVQNQLGPTP